MLILSIMAKAFIIGLSGAMMPGPLLTQTITRSARDGLMASPFIVLGHAILELIVVIGLFFGFSKILTNSTVSGIIGLFGGIVLVWMGFDIIRSTWQGKISLPKRIEDPEKSEELSDGKIHRSVGNILTGTVVSGSNPYFLIWWATAGLALFNQSYSLLGASGPFVFFIGHIMADLAWYLFIGLAVVKGKDLIPDKAYRGLLIFCGLFLLYFSSNFIVYGIKSLS